MCFGLHRRSRPAAFKFFTGTKLCWLFTTAGHSSSEIRKSVQNAPSVCQFDAGRSPTSLNNLVIQLRKVCNHPDLLESVFDGSYFYPPVNEIIGKCGKFQLVDRLLERLFARNHKVLIFSQWTKVPDIMDYYFSEKGFKVSRIDGSVKLDDRKRQIIWHEVGESESEEDRMVYELEQECLEVYRRKVDKANCSRAQLRQQIADSEANL
ncbi:probable ATP-dependent DNA helicase CHR23 isoform X1 [Medicago truncatula]|uniref:probable ATP-dependent DNA helicase CHR23 isoform X1 n=1 Tax=Medicago truncatula TaxID=3880 RepID=UPI000D2F3AD6|nr:probable ATP-dependent DNA helicase CHR23 isoform X1 [Medicago truncatula]XP_024636094.1 probable ATP-dependent DNA helicase CHR23 isoform X1 [Medicago truncatula]XP_039689813.1 probable ATP-dependent DNA helicase CHR23 isoform X1 [Medicago truncatula]